MNLIFTSFSKRKPMIDFKHFFVKNKLKLIPVVYGIWVVVSAVSVYIQPYKYVSCFTDLPDNIKNIPSFLLSFVYLVLFIPAVACIILFMIYFLFIVIRNVLVRQ